MKDGNEKRHMNQDIIIVLKQDWMNLFFQGKNYQLDHAYIRKCKIKLKNGKYNKKDF